MLEKKTNWNILSKHTSSCATSWSVGGMWNCEIGLETCQVREKVQNI